MESSPTSWDPGPTPTPTSPPVYSPTLLVPTSPLDAQPDAQPTLRPSSPCCPTEIHWSPALWSPGPPPTAPPSSDEAEVAQVAEVAEAAEAAAHGLFDATQIAEVAEAAQIAEVAEAAMAAEAAKAAEAAEAAADAEAQERVDRIERLATANDLMRKALAEPADTVASRESRCALLHAADRLLNDTGASSAALLHAADRLLNDTGASSAALAADDDDEFVEYLWDPHDYDWEEGVVSYEYDADFWDPQRKRKRDAKTTRHATCKNKRRG